LKEKIEEQKMGSIVLSDEKQKVKGFAQLVPSLFQTKQQTTMTSLDTKIKSRLIKKTYNDFNMLTL
jgi:hypothetical protein